MRQEPTRKNAVRRAGGPEVVWRCPTCFAPFFSPYASKAHRRITCEPARDMARPAGVVAATRH